MRGVHGEELAQKGEIWLTTYSKVSCNYSLLFAQALFVIRCFVILFGSLLHPKANRTARFSRTITCVSGVGRKSLLFAVNVCCRAIGGLHKPRIARLIKSPSPLLMS